MAKFTRRQWLTLIVIGVADICNAICISLQAPFYPAEAESKGCTATEYGLVFGIFQFVIFIVSPFYGKYINKIGPKIVFNGGIYTTAICAILFGFLDKVNGRYLFISLSFIIRIVEALGSAAFFTACFSTIAKEFPENVATTFASLETFFGLGLIVGPTVGGALYQVGGYTLPFVVMGSTLLAAAVLTAFVLPKHDDTGTDITHGVSILKVLKIPGVFLAASSIVMTSMAIGFLQATLEPHLRAFQLTPVVLGAMFVISGGVYAVIAPGIGWICDNLCPPKYVILLGTLLVAIAFCLIGPAPFIPVQTTLWLCILGLVVHGLGIAAQLVASFSEALTSSIAHGFPNSLETYGLLSGLWTSSFALGAFVGPSLSGILYDSIGFRNSSVFIVVVQLLLGTAITIFVIFGKSQSPYVELKDDKLADINSVYTKSHESLSRSVETGISIERPSLLSSLMACNSYKSQALMEQSPNNVPLHTESSSYGAT